jgi:glutathione peroxidase
MIALFSIFTSHTALVAGESVHDFTVQRIDGEEVALSEYEGKVLLIVNTASKCGFTKQYADLVELQNMYADQGLVVLGFPANNFGNQEPGSNLQILEFCSSTYGVQFPMFEKTQVKGDQQSELFAYLTSAENPDFTGNIRWNFEKFLVDQDGKLVRRFRSMSKPTGKKITQAVDQLLSKQDS